MFLPNSSLASERQYFPQKNWKKKLSQRQSMGRRWLTRRQKVEMRRDLTHMSYFSWRHLTRMRWPKCSVGGSAICLCSICSSYSVAQQSLLNYYHEHRCCKQVAWVKINGTMIIINDSGHCQPLAMQIIARLGPLKNWIPSIVSIRTTWLKCAPLNLVRWHY